MKRIETEGADCSGIERDQFLRDGFYLKGYLAFSNQDYPTASIAITKGIHSL
jgi:hypothetical protein